MSSQERLKYLLKSVLGVDVDKIKARTILALSVDRAKHIPYLTHLWLESLKRRQWLSPYSEDLSVSKKK